MNKVNIKVVHWAIFIFVPLSCYSQNILPTSGNVGIGTTTPACQLEVQGNTDLVGKVVMRDTVKVDGELIIQQNMIIKGVTRADGQFFLNNEVYLPNLKDTSIQQKDKFLLVKADGSVESLEKGGLLATLYGVGDDGSGYNSSCLLIGDDANNNPLYQAPIWQSAGGVGVQTGSLYTGTDCPARVGIGIENPYTTLDVRGNVAIGLPSDFSDMSKINGYHLVVKGKILAERVRVEYYSNWGDYVFYEDYNLMDLADVESYVTENCHLPGIPSAETIAKEGFELQEMDALLMEKIENLYLYVIELKKENQQLKKDIDALKGQ